MFILDVMLLSFLVPFLGVCDFSFLRLMVLFLEALVYFFFEGGYPLVVREVALWLVVFGLLGLEKS